MTDFAHESHISNYVIKVETPTQQAHEYLFKYAPSLLGDNAERELVRLLTNTKEFTNGNQ